MKMLLHTSEIQICSHDCLFSIMIGLKNYFIFDRKWLHFLSSTCIYQDIIIALGLLYSHVSMYSTIQPSLGELSFEDGIEFTNLYIILCYL